MNPYDRIYLLEKAVKKLKNQLCCIGSEGDCPDISAEEGNSLSCLEDGLYVPTSAVPENVAFTNINNLFTASQTITKNIDDANPAFTVNNIQGTGNIVEFENNGFARASLSMSGIFDTLGGYTISGQNSLIPNGGALEVGGGGAFTSLTLLKPTTVSNLANASIGYVKSSVNGVLSRQTGIPDADLSTNVAFKNTANTFTALQSISVADNNTQGLYIFTGPRGVSIYPRTISMPVDSNSSINFMGGGIIKYGNSGQNSQYSLLLTGTVISRDIGDANTALIVNQIHASSTGNILDLQFGGVSKMSIDVNGFIKINGAVEDIAATSNKLLVDGGMTIYDTTTSVPLLALRSSLNVGAFAITNLDGTLGATLQYTGLPGVGNGLLFGTLIDSGNVTILVESSGIAIFNPEGIDLSDQIIPEDIGHGIKTGVPVGGVSLLSDYVRFGEIVTAPAVLDATRYFEMSTGSEILKVALLT